MTSSTYKLVCPHCHSRMRIRTSEGQHIFLRIAYLQCTNDGCGWCVRALFQMTHELVESGERNPNVVLPKADSLIRREHKRSRLREEDEQQLDLVDQLESEEQ